jgi:tRNA nucleotidyltransferase/poly(A) polymerase
MEYSLAAELIEAAQNADVHCSFRAKISRERVLQEIDGMFSGRTCKPAYALWLLHFLGMFDVVFDTSHPELALDILPPYWTDTAALHVIVSDALYRCLCGDRCLSDLSSSELPYEVSQSSIIAQDELSAVRVLLISSALIGLSKLECTEIPEPKKSKASSAQAEEGNQKGKAKQVLKKCSLSSHILRHSLKAETELVRNFDCVHRGKELLVDMLHQFNDTLEIMLSGESSMIEISDNTREDVYEAIGVFVREAKESWRSSIICLFAESLTSKMLFDSAFDHDLLRKPQLPRVIVRYLLINIF